MSAMRLWVGGLESNVDEVLRPGQAVELKK